VLIAVCLMLQADMSLFGVAAIVPAFGLVLFGTLIGLLLAPSAMLFGDVGKMVLVLAPPLMLITPVAYPAQAVQGPLRTLMELNPLTPMVSLSRDLLLTGSGNDWAATGSVIGISLVALLAGWLLYRLALPVLIERLDA
jgi:lipopolysaccharide transport system permease protein